VQDVFACLQVEEYFLVRHGHFRFAGELGSSALVAGAFANLGKV
jgi:hypothetical protein